MAGTVSGIKAPMSDRAKQYIADKKREKMMSERDLLDDDGENRAVRSFLALYGGNTSVTTQKMRSHLAMSGFEDCWPDWTVQDMHLTKGGAQNWIRYLFGLEAQLAAPAPSELAQQIVADTNATLREQTETMQAQAQRIAELEAQLADYAPSERQPEPNTIAEIRSMGEGWYWLQLKDGRRTQVYYPHGTQPMIGECFRG